MSKTVNSKPAFKDATEAQATISAAKDFLKLRKAEAIRFLDEDVELTKTLERITENLDNTPVTEKIETINDALYSIDKMNEFADGRKKINEVIFKKYTSLLIKILESIKFSENFYEITETATRLFKNKFRNSSHLQDKFIWLYNSQDQEDAIREWLGEIINLYIDCYSQAAEIVFLHPRTYFYKETSGGKKRNGHTTSISKKPKTFKSPSIKLATHSKRKKRDLISRVNTAIHEAQHIVVDQMIIAYRLNMVEENHNLYADAELAHTLRKDLFFVTSKKFWSGYKNKLLERVAIEAGNEAERFFNYQTRHPTIRFSLERAGKAIRWSFVDLPRMAPYMPLPKV